MAILLLAATFVQAQTADRWAPFQFLAGKWKAEAGEFSFQPELNGQILVRRNVNNTPGQKHEDLMVVFFEGAPKAIYFDAEGHTIRYTVSFPSKNSAVFDSEDAGPKYRLSYILEGQKLNGKFEVEGKVYLTWTATR
jgi:hypothetical protein